MNPLIVWECLRQTSGCANLSPRKRRCCRSESYRDLRLEIIVGHHRLLWAIPVWTTAFWACGRLIVEGATRYPFMGAAFALKPHDSDRDPDHGPPFYIADDT